MTTRSNHTVKQTKGLKVKRQFTRAGQNPFDAFDYQTLPSAVTDSSGNLVGELIHVEVPVGWSQLAADILAQQYLRKTGVPLPKGKSGGETSVKQVVNRMVSCWRFYGETNGYFATEADASAFQDELTHMLLAQMAAPNSPQWFNTGLFHSYGIKGKEQGHFYVNPTDGKLHKSRGAYERPQPHACYILSVEDELLGEGGIMDLLEREARIFKYGSGVGTNFSALRGKGEVLEGGGYSSGVMSFLKVSDRAAATMKSGGNTRRAAKMVSLDLDHPEILEFIRWKAEEEKKAAILIAAGYPNGYDDEAYNTVSGQNSNNSVRVPDAFIRALLKGGDWSLTARNDGRVITRIPAKKIWDEIVEAAWRSADPGLQFDTRINEWNTCAADGQIRASNPCSEYMFLDNTACNLASLNLRKFWDDQKNELDVEAFKHAVRLWTIVLEISVLMAQLPTAEIAERTFEYRTLGLGYANLGSMLMCAGLPYDSDEARNIAASITALMTGTAYETSAEMAAIMGPFAAFQRNRDHMLRVIRNHRHAVYNTTDSCEGLVVAPQGINPAGCPEYLLTAACQVWDSALKKGEQHGFRNAQVTALAPTGTIGLLMNCDTAGIEPDFSLVKYKKFAGGGFVKMVNQSVGHALDRLGYSETEIKAIVEHMLAKGNIEFAPHIKPEHIPVFDCANRCGTEGKRFLSASSHLKMMSAAQPFLSGAISKTINLPHETTATQIKDAYFMAWQLGLKGCSIYRDGCKASQPLNVAAPKAIVVEKPVMDPMAITPQILLEAARRLMAESKDTSLKRELSRIVERKRLPEKRRGFTQKSKIAGHTVFVRTGEYDDGTVGEVFIDMHKEGVSFRSLLNCFAISVSLGLQYGVPLEEFVEKFTFTRFEPAGAVEHPNIRMSTSVLDYVFRLLAMEYLGRTDLVHLHDSNAKSGEEDLAEKILSKQDTTPAPKTNGLPINPPPVVDKVKVVQSGPNTHGQKTSQASMGNYQFNDAPICNMCGHITVRSGTCFKCMNCGTDLGCS
jgi:adenosylcobalamin-dependent ribonucleoside-diphosphate reductase